MFYRTLLARREGFRRVITAAASFFLDGIGQSRYTPRSDLAGFRQMSAALVGEGGAYDIRLDSRDREDSPVWARHVRRVMAGWACARWESLWHREFSSLRRRVPIGTSLPRLGANLHLRAGCVRRY